jgi:hypothetical protein
MPVHPVQVRRGDLDVEAGALQAEEAEQRVADLEQREPGRSPARLVAGYAGGISSSE